MTSSLRICIIGGGAAGLCSARHASLNSMTPVIFEQSSVIGGTWIYDEETGINSKTGLPIHSSMYKSLRTNLPKEVMAFPDFPFNQSFKSFLTHTQVKQYLFDYSKQYDLDSFIKLNTIVEKVNPVNDGSWTVTSRDVVTGKSSVSDFDAVMVCNGHYSVPAFGHIANIEKFTGTQMHSHDYREQSVFRGHTVVVFGAAASGVDIGLEVATEAKKVYLSHNNDPIISDLPPNVQQIPGLKACKGDQSLLLNDGTTVNDVDMILHCTGYKYRFPFLDEGSLVEIDDEKRMVKPLYKHLIHCDHPTLSFVGIPIKICPFPLFDYQVRFFLKTLTKEVQLPSASKMKEDTEMELRKKVKSGIPEKHFHKFGDLQWRYNDDLAEMAKLEKLDVRVEKLYNDIHIWRRKHLMTYKDENYFLEGESYVRI